MHTTTSMPIAALGAVLLAALVVRHDLARERPMAEIARMVHMQASDRDLVVLAGGDLRHQLGRFAPLAAVASDQLPADIELFGRVFVVHRGDADAMVESLSGRGIDLWERRVPPLSVLLVQLEGAELPVAGLETLLPAAEVALVDADGAVTTCTWMGDGHRCRAAQRATTLHALTAPDGEPRRCTGLRLHAGQETRILLRPPPGATHVAGWLALDPSEGPAGDATVEIDVGTASRTVLVSTSLPLAEVDWALPLDAGDATTLHLRSGADPVGVCAALRWTRRAPAGAP